MKKQNVLTQTRLKELLSYDPETGFFFKVSPPCANGTLVPVGYLDDGYLSTRIDGKRHRLHRLAWLYYYGYFPPEHTDHINGVRSDNRICNLRLATTAENIRNGKFRKNNTSGFKGVRFVKKTGRWIGEVRFCRKQYHTLSFATAREAAKVLSVLRAKLHGEFANHG